MADLSDDQINKLIKALKTAKEKEVSTKSGFLKFLENLGMHSLSQKLGNSPMWDKVWSAIQDFFNAVGNAIEWAMEKLEELFSDF